MSERAIEHSQPSGEDQTHSKLHAQAVHTLTGAHRQARVTDNDHDNSPLPLLSDGTYFVKNERTLTSVARRALAGSGGDPSDPIAVAGEEDNIRAQNLKWYPQLAKSNAVERDWQLQITSKDQPPPVHRLELTPPAPEGANYMGLDAAGNYTVKREDNAMMAVALKTLAWRGHYPKDINEVFGEAYRIAHAPENVARYPQLGTADWNKITPGMKLKISDPSVGPDPAHEWKPFIQARPNAVTWAWRGERVQAVPGSNVIAAPGALVRNERDSISYVFPNAYGDAYGGHTFAAGTVTAHGKADVVPVYNTAKVTRVAEAPEAIKPQSQPQPQSRPYWQNNYSGGG